MLSLPVLILIAISQRGVAFADLLEAAAYANSGGGLGAKNFAAGVNFFLLWWSSLFAGVFVKNGAQNVVFLMVKSWWNAGKRWSENDLKSASKNTPLSLDLFLGFPVLGKRGRP